MAADSRHPEGEASRLYSKAQRKKFFLSSADALSHSTLSPSSVGNPFSTGAAGADVAVVEEVEAGFDAVAAAAPPAAAAPAVAGAELSVGSCGR